MTLTATRRRMFINGEWTDAAEGETTPVINPATEETIADVPKGTVADVDRAVAAARAAFEEWSQTTPGERSTMLWRWASLSSTTSRLLGTVSMKEEIRENALSRASLLTGFVR